MNALTATRALRPSLIRLAASPAACTGVRHLHASAALKKAAAAGAVGHKESSHWKAERIVTVGMLGLIPAAAVVGPCMPIDMAMGVLFPLHGYWGLDQVITDYVHGGAKTAASAFNKLFLAGTVGGLTYFNYNDVGLTKAVSDLWSL